MLVDCFGFIYGRFRVFAAAGCVASGFAVSCLAAAGFVALGLAAAGLAVVRFMQRRVHHSDAFDTWQLPTPQSATLPNPMWGKRGVRTCRSR